MDNLFSIFDPLIHFQSLPLNWVSIFSFLFILPSKFWVSRSELVESFVILARYMHNEIMAIMGGISVPGSSMIMVVFFLYIIFNNLFGLLPYVFTASSHLTFSVSLALPLWLGHIIYSWVKQPLFMLSHLVPMGTPYALMPFMVVIEIISNIIRPLTLSVRLAANMVAGHLLLTLLGGQGPSVSYFLILGVLGALLLMSVLEVAVAAIQAYVFSVLSSLYLNEVNSEKLVKSM